MTGELGRVSLAVASQQTWHRGGLAVAATASDGWEQTIVHIYVLLFQNTVCDNGAAAAVTESPMTDGGYWVGTLI